MVIRIGDTSIPGNIGNPVQVEPGIYTIDFELPAALDMAGDQPVIISILVNSNFYVGRLDDTAPRVRIL